MALLSRCHLFRFWLLCGTFGLLLQQTLGSRPSVSQAIAVHVSSFDNQVRRAASHRVAKEEQGNARGLVETVPNTLPITVRVPGGQIDGAVFNLGEDDFLLNSNQFLCKCKKLSRSGNCRCFEPDNCECPVTQYVAQHGANMKLYVVIAPLWGPMPWTDSELCPKCGIGEYKKYHQEDTIKYLIIEYHKEDDHKEDDKEYYVGGPFKKTGVKRGGEREYAWWSFGTDDESALEASATKFPITEWWKCSEKNRPDCIQQIHDFLEAPWRAPHLGERSCGLCLDQNSTSQAHLRERLNTVDSKSRRTRQLLPDMESIESLVLVNDMQVMGTA